jgi:hypothetical protein
MSPMLTAHSTEVRRKSTRRSAQRLGEQVLRGIELAINGILEGCRNKQCNNGEVSKNELDDIISLT